MLPELPAGPAILKVVENDRSYTLRPPGNISAGRAVLHVTNQSNSNHDLSLVALSEETPPIKEQLRSPIRQAAKTLARLPSRKPGSVEAFAVDLPPGRYGLVCFEKDEAGTPHALTGMAIEFRAVGPSSLGR